MSFQLIFYWKTVQILILWEYGNMNYHNTDEIHTEMKTTSLAITIL